LRRSRQQHQFLKADDRDWRSERQVPTHKLPLSGAAADPESRRSFTFPLKDR